MWGRDLNLGPLHDQHILLTFELSPAWYYRKMQQFGCHTLEWNYFISSNNPVCRTWRQSLGLGPELNSVLFLPDQESDRLSSTSQDCSCWNCWLYNAYTTWGPSWLRIHELDSCPLDSSAVSLASLFLCPLATFPFPADGHVDSTSQVSNLRRDEQVFPQLPWMSVSAYVCSLCLSWARYWLSHQARIIVTMKEEQLLNGNGLVGGRSG